MFLTMNGIQRACHDEKSKNHLNIPYEYLLRRLLFPSIRTLMSRLEIRYTRNRGELRDLDCDEHNQFLPGREGARRANIL
jgi:hypothetical protein